MKKKFLVLVIRILSALSSIILTFIITRSLSLNESGIVLFCLSMLYISAFCTRVGLDQPVLKNSAIFFKANEFDRVALVMGHAMRVTTTVFTIAFVILCVTLFVSFFLMKTYFDIQVAILLAFTVLPYSLCVCYSYGFQGLERINFAFVARQLAFPLTVSLLVLLLHVIGFNLSAPGVLVCFFTASVINLFIQSILWVRLVVRPDFVSNKFIADKLNDRLGYFFISGLFVTCSQWLAPIIVGLFASATDVTFIAVASRLAMLISFVHGIATSLLLPKLAYLFSENKLEDVSIMIGRYGRFSLIAAVPFVSIYLYAPATVLSIFGENYEDAASALTVLTLAQLFNVTTGCVSHILQMSGNQKAHFNNVLISGLFLIFFLPIASFHSGYIGAAWAIAAASILQNVLGSFTVYRIHRINVFKSILFSKSGFRT